MKSESKSIDAKTSAKSCYSEKEKKALRLLNEYKQGNTGAFTTLYNMYAVTLLNYGTCLTPDKELVKDCVQDVFVKLLTKCQKSNITRVGSYLVISLRNRLLDEFRRGCFVSDAPVNDTTMRKHNESVEMTYIKNEHQEEVRNDVDELFTELTPRQQKAFQLYFIEQKKYDEICDIMQMNYPCVRNLVHRGMVKLRTSDTYQRLSMAAR